MKKILIIIKICCILFVSDCLAFNLEDAFFSKKRCNFERRKSCELSNTNLSGLVLKYASTWGINLSNANLSNTDLSGSLLINANLTGANLQNSNLVSANLAGANLAGANLNEAKFDKHTILCNTTGPDGKKVFLNCKKAALYYANLEKLNLGKKNFSNSILHYSYLAYSNLKGANLSFSSLRSSDLTGADLTDANISGVQINNKTQICNTKMINGRRSFKNCNESNLRGADLRNINLNKINFINADLTEADLRGASLVEANLSRANLTGIKVNGPELSGAKLDGAILCKTSLLECRGFEYKNKNKLLDGVITAYTNKKIMVRGKHFSAYAIDSDTKGNIFIGNYRKNEIIIMDENLNKKSLIKNTPMPHGITVDSSGNIYVSTFMKGRVLKFNKNLKLIPGWDLRLRNSGLLKQPIPLTHDESDNIYIGDYLGNILKVDSEGKMVSVFEKKEEPNFYHGLSIYKNKLYAAVRPSLKSPGRGKIRVFDLNGKYIKDFESPKDGIDPLSVKIIFNKYFLVPNFWKEQLFPFYLFNEDGKVVGYLGEIGNKDGEFLSPTNFVYSSKGYIYVVEDRSNRIQKIRLKDLKLNDKTQQINH